VTPYLFPDLLHRVGTLVVRWPEILDVGVPPIADGLARVTFTAGIGVGGRSLAQDRAGEFSGDTPFSRTLGSGDKVSVRETPTLQRREKGPRHPGLSLAVL